MRILRKKGKFAEKKQRKGLWRSMVMCIAALVVFCTTYALILPAITMETQGFSCGLTEHQHSQDCYQLTCGKQEYFSHTHGKECYQDKVLVCKLTERTVHHHSDDCYSKPEYACGLKESKGHAHSEGCYTTERSLICTQSECAPHTHSDGCYTVEVISCKLEESKGHSHSEDCYTDGELTCSKEESEGHTHSDACTKTKQVLTCTLAETQGHSHGGSCYEEKQVLSCGKEERKGHTHSDKCYPSDFQSKLICGQEDIPEHRHSQSCYARVCELEEHTHSELCVKSHEEFLQNKEELLNKEEQTDPKDNSSENEEQTPENSEEQPSENEKQTPENEEQTPENSEEQPSENEEQAPENSEEQPSENEEQTPENSEEQSSENEEQAPENSEEQPSENEEQAPENSEEQPSENEEQTPENSEEQPSENEEQTPENSEEQPSGEEELTTENSEEQPSENEEQAPENSEEQPSENEEQTPENSEEQPSENEEQGQLEAENEIDWTDSLNAEEAGYVLICAADEAEHVHDEECYVPLDAMSQISQGTQYATVHMTARAAAELPVGNSLSAVKTEYDPTKDSFSTLVTVTFSFPGQADQKAVSPDTVYTYTYPNGIIIPDGLLNTEQTLLDKSGNQAGTYRFIKNADGTYSVQAVFSQEYVDKNVGTGTDHPVEGYINYGYDFSGSQLKDDKLQFGNDGYLLPVSGNIIYPQDTTESYHIDVSKEGSWVQEGDKLVYTVYVRTAKGTPDPITFSDSMAIPEGLTLGEPTVSIQKGTAITCYQDWNNSWRYDDRNDWATVTDVTPNYSAGVLNMSLPSLKASPDSTNPSNIISDVYKVTYTYPISDQTQASVSPNNSVSVSATDSSKGQTVSDGADQTVTVTKDFSYTVDKSGAMASDKPGYIQWTVTVNSNKQNLVEAELTDEMLKNAEDVTISPNSGATVNTADGKITFSPDANGVNKNTYIITYYTPVEQTWDGTTVNNKATLDPTPDTPDDEKEATASVTVSGVQLGKTGSHNAVTDKLDWVITVNSGNLDIANATLTDAMFAALNENAFTIQPETGYSFTMDSDNKITGITFKAVTDGKNTQNYTITYSTSIPASEEGSPVTSVTNTATLSPPPEEIGKPIPATSTITLEEASLNKGGHYDSWNGRINWTVTVNDNNKDIATAVFTDSMLGQLVPGDITIQDGNWNPIPAESDQYTINTEAGKVTSIVFNPIGDSGVNTNKYIITYFTSALQEWKDKTVHNEAKLTLDGKEIPAPADVTVPGSGDIAKSAGGGTVSEDGRTITIPWTVTLTIPKGGLPINTLVIDDVTRKDEWTTNTNQWITAEQANALIAAGMRWTDDSGNEKGIVTLSDGQVTFTGSADAYTGFKVTFQDGLTPPEGATKLTFTYNTTADLTKTTTGQNLFYNFVSVGEKTKGAEYIHYKPGVVKTDGQWQTGDTNVSSSGNVTWKVKAIVGKGNKLLTLIDTLPEGVTLESLHLSGGSNLNVTLAVAEDGAISGADTTNRCSISGTYSGQVITLNIKPQAEGQTLIDGEEFILTVNGRVTDGENATGSKTLTNTVTMKLDDDEIGSSSQTQTWTYQVDTPDVVSKNGTWNNNARLLTYTVVINPEGKDLDSGSDRLELKDVLKYKKKLDVYLNEAPWYVVVDINISLTPGSVTLKDTRTEEPVTDWSWLYSTAAESEWSQVNTLTVTIPDSTPLQLEYSYSVSSNAKKGYSFELVVSNTATLQNQYSDVDNLESGSKWSNQTTSGGVTSSSSLLTLTKVNAANNGEYLPGAEFTVYAYRQKTVEGATTASWEYEQKYTTDDKGAITISQGDASKNEKVFDTDVLFKVVETKAPNGYLLPDSPPEYYFYFSGSHSASMVLPDGVSLTSAIDLNKIGNSILVKNTKIPTTSIQVNKKWFDSAGNETTENLPQSIQFDLYRTASATKPGSGGGGSASGSIAWVFAGDKSYESPQTGTFSGMNIGDKVKITLNMNYSCSGWMTISWNGVSGGDGAWNEAGNIYEYTCTVSSDTISIGVTSSINCFHSVAAVVLQSSGTSGTGSGSGSTPPTGGTKYGSYTLSAANNWAFTIDDLPISYTDAKGNTLYYAYYVVETTTGFSVSYENDGGISSGTITIKNTKTSTPSYTLPNTGGMGTQVYTVTGLAVSIGAVVGLMKKRKKGGRA